MKRQRNILCLSQHSIQLQGRNNNENEKEKVALKFKDQLRTTFIK